MKPITLYILIGLILTTIVIIKDGGSKGYKEFVNEILEETSYIFTPGFIGSFIFFISVITWPFILVKKLFSLFENK